MSNEFKFNLQSPPKLVSALKATLTLLILISAEAPTPTPINSAWAEYPALASLIPILAVREIFVPSMEKVRLIDKLMDGIYDDST